MDATPLYLIRAPDDVLLADRCVRGQRAAQRELFDRERKRVHYTLFRLLGSNGPIEDLIQEAFIEVFRSLRHFRGEAKLSTWIDRITVRVAYGYIGRRRAPTVQIDLVAEPPTQDPTPEQSTLDREAARRVYGLLHRLEAKQRIAFTLHVIDGRPLSDVAEVMEASLVATKTRVWRARRFIEKCARRDPALVRFVAELAAEGEGEG